MTRRHLTAAIAFAGIVILIDRGMGIGLQFLYARVRSAPEGGFVQAARSADADIVILGSSRALRHCDPQVLERITGLRTYNAGADGQGTPYMRAAADLLLATNRPALFLLNIDAASNAIKLRQGFISGFTTRS